MRNAWWSQLVFLFTGLFLVQNSVDGQEKQLEPLFTISTPANLPVNVDFGGAVFTPNSDRLLACLVGTDIGVDARLRVKPGWVLAYDAQTGKQITGLHACARDYVRSLALSPDGKRLATASAFDVLKVWDPAGKLAFSLEREGVRVSNVRFSPDGKLLAFSKGGTVKFCAADTGKEVASLVAGSDRVFSMAFSPDGKKLATGGEDGTVRVWNVATREEVLCIRKNERSVGYDYVEAISPDGRRAAITGRCYDEGRKIWAGEVRIVDLATGKDVLLLEHSSSQEVRKSEPGFLLAMHQVTVAGVKFSPDGRYLASSGYDHTAQIWDARTGRRLRTLPGHTAWVRGVAFSPDGRRLASVGASIKVWDLAKAVE